LAEKGLLARGKELIVGILCRFCFGGAEFSGENGLAGIVAYRPVALMKEAFVVSPYPR